MRSAVRQGASVLQRRRVHEALADALEAEPDRRVWHRAALITGVHEDVAAELEEAGRRARRRGAIGVAVTALRRAAELSEPAQRAGAPARRGEARLRARAAATSSPRCCARSSSSSRDRSTGRAPPGSKRWSIYDRSSADMGRGADRRCRAGRRGRRSRPARRPALARRHALRGGQTPVPRRGGSSSRRRIALATPTTCACSRSRPTPTRSATRRRCWPASGRPPLSAVATRRPCGTSARPRSPSAPSTSASTLLGAAVDGLRAEGRLGHLPRVLALHGIVAARLADWDVAIPAADGGRRLAIELGEPLWKAGADTVVSHDRRHAR